MKLVEKCISRFSENEKWASFVLTGNSYNDEIISIITFENFIFFEKENCFLFRSLLIELFWYLLILIFYINRDYYPSDGRVKVTVQETTTEIEPTNGFGSTGSPFIRSDYEQNFTTNGHTASNATKELDDLMASLSEFKVGYFFFFILCYLNSICFFFFHYFDE